MRSTRINKLAIQFQTRDLALLRDLFESRIMTAAHVATLHFDGKKEATKKRLQKLKSAGFITERRRRAYDPAILFLARAGLKLLADEGILAEYPKISSSTLEKRARVAESTVRHELEVMDVKAAFHSAVRKASAFQITEFTTWPLLSEFVADRPGYGGAPMPVAPDGFLRIQEAGTGTDLFEHTFFLEVDRSSEVQDRLVGKAGCYLDYYKSGEFAVRNGGERHNYQEFPFRVLMVFKTAERRNNTGLRLLYGKPPILTQVWLATISDALRDPLGPIWLRPVDFQTVTSFAAFQGRRSSDFHAYKRQTEREVFVENRIKKHRILADIPEA